MNYRRTQEDLNKILNHAKIDPKSLTRVSQVIQQEEYTLKSLIKLSF